MQESKFDDAGVLWFREKKKKPLDPKRFQSAMFIDRPDLWKPSTRRRTHKVPSEQIPLPGDSPPLFSFANWFSGHVALPLAQSGHSVLSAPWWPENTGHQANRKGYLPMPCVFLLKKPTPKLPRHIKTDLATTPVQILLLRGFLSRRGKFSVVGQSLKPGSTKMTTARGPRGVNFRQSSFFHIFCCFLGGQ